MIQSASFRNFKSLRHVDVDFERLTVFVGPNGAGKSSILEGLYYLLKCSPAVVASVFRGSLEPRLLHSRGAGGEMQLACFGTDHAVRLTFTFESNPPDTQINDDDPRTSQHRFEFETKSLRPNDTPWTKLKRNAKRPAEFRKAALLRLDARKLSQPSYVDHPTSRIDQDGEGLASALAFMALNRPEQFQALQQSIRSVVPSVKRIRFDRVPILKTETQFVKVDDEEIGRQVKRQYMGDALILDYEGAPDIPAHLASDGTILVLGLLAGLLGPSQPNLILVDDLELGLHPKAQRKLIPLLRTILSENQDLQIIATTHSPYVVDELEPKEVRITWAGEDGVTQCARLDSHPEFERWKDEMWPGEFWSLVGEQWVANGQGPVKP